MHGAKMKSQNHIAKFTSLTLKRWRMKFKSRTLKKFLILGFLLVTLKIRPILSSEQTIQRITQASDVFGKTGSEAEMAYFSQILGFVDDKDEFGSSMQNFLKKFLEMQNGKLVHQRKHWKNEEETNYVLLSNHCYNYLADDILIRSGITYDTAQLFAEEKKFNIELDYYTHDIFETLALQCRVMVYHKPSYLYFMKFSDDEDQRNSSYFMLASKLSSQEPKLRIVMYTNRQLATINDRELLVMPYSLMSTDEDKDLPESTVPRRPLGDEIDFRKLLIFPRRYSKGEGPVTLFGQDAERVFITSYSYNFINLGLKNSYVDEFIYFIAKMKKGRGVIPGVTSVKQYRDPQYKTKFCSKSILSNGALQFHHIIPVNDPLFEITVSSNTAVFPRTHLPSVKFSFPMLKCPALMGVERKPIIIFVQLVAYHVIKEKYRTFALLKSRKIPGTVYPVTLTDRTYDFSDPLEREKIEEKVPSIFEDEELGPVIEETQAETSTSSAHSLPES